MDVINFWTNLESRTNAEGEDIMVVSKTASEETMAGTVVFGHADIISLIIKEKIQGRLNSIVFI